MEEIHEVILDKDGNEIPVEEEKKEKSFFEKLKDTKKRFGEFIEKNPAMIIPLVSAGTMIVRGLFGTLIGAGSVNQAHCMVKDDTTGLKYLCKHPLNNQEILELSDLKTRGELTTGEALVEMDVLKKERKRK